MRGRLAHVLPLLASIAILPNICGAARADISTDDRASMDDCLNSARQKNQRQEVCIGRIEDSCAASETECAAREIAYWDDLLNKSYREALAAGGGQGQALRALQRQWIGWRDARCGYAATYNRKGASSRAAKDHCIAEETARRALELSATPSTSRSEHDYPIVTDDEEPTPQQGPPSGTNAARPAPSQAAATASNSDSGELLSQPPAWFGSFTPGPSEMKPGAAPAPQPEPAPSPQFAYAPQPEEQQQPPAPSPVTEIKVVVENVQTSDGTVVVALCDKDLSQPGCPYHQVVQASSGSVEATFDNVPPGRYAVGAFHDENDNKDFDRSGMGIPNEPYALSNGASEKMVPSFQDAAIEIPKGETTVTLRLRRFGE